MPPKSKSNTEVHECIFMAKIAQVQMMYRLPCKLFVNWKDTHDYNITKTQNDEAVLENNVAVFNQNIGFRAYLLYEKSNEQYIKKQTNLTVSLFLTKKPTDKKLIGKVSLQLSDVINGKFEEQKKYELQFGNAKNRFLVFSAFLISKRPTNKKPNQININNFQSIDLEEILKEKLKEQPISKQQPKKPEMSITSPMKKALSIERQITHQSSAERSRKVEDSKLASETQVENLKFEEENKKLFDMVNHSNEQLAKQRKETMKLKEELKKKDRKLQDLEEEKNDITQELLNQVQEETKKCFCLEEKLKQNEEIRLDMQTENLQLKFQLTSAKEELEKNPNEEIAHLKKKISQLQSELKNSGKNSLTQFNIAFNILKQEKMKLEEHLMAMQKDRDILEEQNRLLEEELSKIDRQRNKSVTLESNLQKSKEQVHLLNEKIKQLMFENDKLRQKGVKNLQDKDIILSQKELQIKTTRKYLENKNEQIQSLNDKMDELRQEKKKEEEEIQKLTNQIKQLQNISKILNKQQQSEKGKKESLVTRVNEMNKIRTQLTHRNLFLQNQRQVLTGKMQKYHNEIRSKDESLKERKVYAEVLSKQLEEELRNNQELQEKITKFAEKQMKMRENILILEEQSRKIYDIVLEKEQYEEFQNNILLQKEEELEYLRVELNQVKMKFDQEVRHSGQLKKQIFALKQSAIRKTNELIEHEQFQEKIDNLQKKRIQQLEQEKLKLIETLKSQGQVQKKTVKAEQEKIKLEKGRIAMIENEKNSLKKEKKELLQKNKILEFNIQTLEQKISDLQEGIEKVNANKYKQVSRKEEDNYLKKENIRLQRLIQSYEFKLNQQQNKYDEYFDQVEMVESQYSPVKLLNKNDPKLVEIYENLRILIDQRSQKRQSETTIQFLIGKVQVLEDNFSKITKERGIIQEVARKLSMEIQQIKTNLLKSKANVTQKRELILSLKPCEGIVKQIISLAENLSVENLQTQYD